MRGQTSLETIKMASLEQDATTNELRRSCVAIRRGAGPLDTVNYNASCSDCLSHTSNTIHDDNVLV